MTDTELTAEERAYYEQSHDAAPLLRLYDAALARVEAAERDKNSAIFAVGRWERECTLAKSELDKAEVYRVAAESRLAEAAALLERAARIVENDDWRDAYDRWRSGCTFAADGSAEYSRTPEPAAPCAPPPSIYDVPEDRAILAAIHRATNPAPAAKAEPTLRPEFIALGKALTEPLLCFEGDCAKMTGRARPCPIHDPAPAEKAEPTLAEAQPGKLANNAGVRAGAGRVQGLRQYQGLHPRQQGRWGVNRYELREQSTNPWESYRDMSLDEEGDWVRHEDVVALRARVAELESVALKAKLAKAERAVECVTKVVRRWRAADTEGKNVMLANLEWALAGTEVIGP